MIDTGCPKCGTLIKVATQTCPRCKAPLPETIKSILRDQYSDRPQYSLVTSPLKYIGKHWRGELPLPVSYWINFFFLGWIIQFAVQNFLPSFFHILALEFNPHPASVARLTIFMVLFFLLLFYPWMVIGTWRACNKRIMKKKNSVLWRKEGSSFWPIAAQLLIVSNMFFMAWGTYTTRAYLNQLYRLSTTLKKEPPNYTLELIKNNTFLRLNGTLDLGVSSEVNLFLLKYPEVKGIVLDSQGGVLYEGRALAELIRERKLNTYSLKKCSSSCVIAFVSGEKRYMGVNSKLGFHQPHHDLDGLDSEAKIMISEEDIKRTYEEYSLEFKNSSVNKDFIARMFGAPSNDMWYPQINELIDANVVHEVIESI